MNEKTESKDPLTIALEFAEEICCCESYYRYTCFRCQKIAEGKMPDMKEAVELGYATWDGYGAPNLTNEGRHCLKVRRAARKG